MLGRGKVEGHSNVADLLKGVGGSFSSSNKDVLRDLDERF
jgi:hypothetical protein